MKRLCFLLAFPMFCLSMWGQASSSSPYKAQVRGTLRTKWEYQTEEKTQRFQMRNARVGIEGKTSPYLSYKAEADLSDEGQLKIIDIWGEVQGNLRRGHDLRLRAGQFRVPFGLEAHRSPHKRFFANRSFLAKHMVNHRDIGIMGQWKKHYGASQKGLVALDLGLFSGSGLTDHKNYWTSDLYHSLRMTCTLPWGLTLVGSAMNTHRTAADYAAYDVLLNYRNEGFFVETEFLFKRYADKAFADVRGFQAVAMYDLPLWPSSKGTSIFDKMRILARYDYMGDHTDARATDKATKSLLLTDPARGRITGGFTFRFAKDVVGKNDAELRLNYEKYLYQAQNQVLTKISERDKLVVELMMRF